MRDFGLTRLRPHPKAQGRPFVVMAPNRLSQKDIAAPWCGEDGGGYLTAMVDCFDRSLLGWSFTPRCSRRDFSPAMEQAWSTAWLYGPEAPPSVVMRHDNHPVHPGALPRGRAPTRHQTRAHPLPTSRRHRACRADFFLNQTRRDVASGSRIIRRGARFGLEIDPRLQPSATTRVAQVLNAGRSRVGAA
jgi:hypothetical protein